MLARTFEAGDVAVAKQSVEASPRRLVVGLDVGDPTILRDHQGWKKGRTRRSASTP